MDRRSSEVAPPDTAPAAPRAVSDTRPLRSSFVSMLVGGLIKFFTSLRLTVVLLAFAIVLLFVGTLAQADEGLYNAQSRYFRQWFVLGLDLFGHRIPLILPGGYLIGTMLLINLLAAHIYRFQFSVKKIGIQLAHSGVILLLAGQLATDIFAHESQMQFLEGETKSYSESAQNYELIFETPLGPHTDQVVSIPASLLARGGVIQDPNLPFAIRVSKFWKNSGEPMFRAPMMQHDAPVANNGVALNFDFQQAPEVKATDEKNVPTALVELSRQNGSLGNWIVSAWTTDEGLIQGVREDSAQMLNANPSDPMVKTIVDDLTKPQTVDVDGKHFTFYLRSERTRFPFSLTLLKATHEEYPGTDIPKDYRSLVLLQNRHTGESRQVEISMNNPLRYDGLTFYQYQMDVREAAQQAGHAPSSVLQVVHNPSWLTPYIACVLVAAGLVIQFMFHLTGFIARRK